MTMRCRACDHPARAEIDVALARGISAGWIAQKFAVSRSSVSRHKRNGHIPPAIIDAFPKHRPDLSAEALAQLRCDESAGILLNLARQRRILLGLQDEAVRKKWRPLVLKAAGQIHRNVELTARAVGEFAQHERAVHQTNVLSVMMLPDYVKLRAGLIAALRSYPAARKAVGEVLAELERAPVHFDGIKGGVVDGVAQIEGLITDG